MTHGTDIGPKCDACGGTVWGYALIGPPDTWRATCIACRASDLVRCTSSDVSALRGAHCERDSADALAERCRAVLAGHTVLHNAIMRHRALVHLLCTGVQS